MVSGQKQTVRRLRSAVLAAARLGGRGGFTCFIIAQVPAGQRDEYVFQTDVPRCEADQRAVLAVEFVEQGGDREVRLGDCQRVTIMLDPSGEYRVETSERICFLDFRGAAASSANSTIWSPPSRAINSAGDPWAMILP